MAVTTVTVDAGEGSRDEATVTSSDRAFLRWGAASYLVTLGVLLALALRATGGRMVYTLDDPAIHLSLAENLVHHGTWGVVPGHFQSASSSPMWTVLLSGYLVVSPVSDALGPLLFNVASALAVIAILGANQTVLRPSLRRPVDAVAVAALVTVPLFLPALTLVGMEHTLHMALVLGAVVLFHRRVRGDPAWGPPWLPYVLLALGTVTRLETAFVAVGIAVALLARCLPGWGPEGGAAAWRPEVRRAALVGLSAAIPLAVIVAFTKVMGQGLLPNSVLAKAQTDAQAGAGWPVRSAFERLTTDPLVAALTAMAVGALAVAWRRDRRHVFPTTVFVVTVALHVSFARMGWYERYQAYLVLLGVYAGLQLAADALPAARRRARPRLVAALVLASLLFTSTKAGLTVDAVDAVSDTYQQRYQAGRFLGRYYDGQPVATGELGYVSLMHDGPVSDLFGLGDYEILRARRAAADHPPPEYWEQLARDRGIDVVAVYPSTLLMETPESWILVGSWVLPRRVVSAWEPTFQFWATTPDVVAPLQRQLREYASELPSGVVVRFNELASMRAAQLTSGAGEQAPAAPGRAAG